MKKFFKNINYLFQSIRKSEPLLGLYMLIQVVTSTLVVLLGLRLTESVVALVSAPPTLRVLILSIVQAVALLSFITILDILVKSKIASISQKYRITNLAIYMDKYMSTDFQSILQSDYQSLMNSVMNASSGDNSLDGVFIAHIVTFLHQALQIVLLTSLLFVLDTNFIYIIFIMITLTFIYRIYQAKVIESMREERATYSKKINYLLEESGNFKVAKDMRLYGVKHWFNDIFENLLQESTALLKKSSFVVLLGQIISGLLVAVLTAYGYYIFVKSYMNYTMTLSQLTFYIGAITTIASSSFTFIGSIFDLYQDSKEIEPIMNYYNYPNVFNHEGESFNFDTIDSIEFVDVSFKYPGSNKSTFENFNLKINAEEKIAVVGLNGAGKSTLVKLICNLLKPNTGKILINGIDNQSFNLNDYYDQFSVVFQEQFAMPISIKDTIIQQQDFDAERYQEVLNTSGVQDFLSQFPKGDETSIVQALDAESVNLSGGQLQKLKLAQALYKNGKILILDEPTAALDPISESEVYQNYFKLSKNKISLFITHRLASTQFCDRIIYIEQGQVIEDGSHHDLLDKKGKYFDLFETQAYYYKEELQYEH